MKSLRVSRFAPGPQKLVRMDHILIAAIFTLIIISLLVIANIGMDVLTSMRAFVGGEGLWSKSQKDAVHYLLQYSTSRADRDYQRYERAIAVPLADHEARLELERPVVNRQRAGEAFVRARNHPDDVQGMVNLFMRYHDEPHIEHAISVWREADKYLIELQQTGSALRAELTGSSADPERIRGLVAQVNDLNDRLPGLEDDFSKSLGDAARYARSVVFLTLAAAALFALLLGLFVFYRLLLRARDADEQYRHLFETASDAVIIAERQTGLILDANVKLAELTGLSVAELRGTRQADLFGREIPVMGGSSDLESGDLVIRHLGGASIPVDVRTSQGRLGRRVVDYSVVRDIRERRRMEEKIRESARLESVGRLAGGVAHDFNNLLTVIAGYTQSLRRSTGGETRNKVDHIRNAANRAAALVRQLLAFSRKQPLLTQTLDLNQVIRQMEGLIRGVLNEQIELILDLDDAAGAVEADPHQLEQIILNLVTNARDAMPSHGRLIIKTWNHNTAAGDYVAFSIADTGHGMDDVIRSRLFEPFFTTKSQGKGTGLGLAMVYGTVKQSRGEISVESEIGKGATFRILLPRTSDGVGRPPELPDVETSAGTETILLVEDDSAVRETLASGLEQEGYRVFVAANGREGLDQFAKYSDEIAILVTDLVMPEMGGIALGGQLRDTGATVPILYMTGFHQDLEKYPSDQLPLFGGFLLKPFNPHTLASTIRRVLALSGAASPTAR